MTDKQLEKLKKSLPEPKVSSNSLEIMKKRSFLKDASGKSAEEPRDMFFRVASFIAGADKNYKTDGKKIDLEETVAEFYDLIASNRFLPGARVLYEAGNNIDGTGQLASCFVLPIEDDLNQIFQTMQDAAVVQKNNGGTGFNFSHIRPKGDSVGGTPNVAAGPLHFIKSYSQSFDLILQGKKRGGGNMAILNIDHPDIIDFINLKGVESSIRNFNISVGVTDKFMHALKNDDEYELVNPRTQETARSIRAQEVFDLISKKAWECADPGLFFLDTAQDANPNKNLGVIEATNPCGEEPLRAYESCNLGSVVLPSHVSTNNTEPEIDWDKLRQSVHSAIHFLDNMIDLSRYPLPQIDEEVRKTRKIGLGVVGLGTMFYKLEIPYDSEEAVELTKKIVNFMQDEAISASQELASLRGVFPEFEGSIWDEKDLRVRNAALSSIAPTGTLSLIANTSSGIEPIFSLVYHYSGFYQDGESEQRESLLYVNEQFKQHAKSKGFYSKELMEKIAENGGSLGQIEEIPEGAKNIFKVTHDVSPNWHVKMQAAAQESVDAAVSKTINLPSDATVEDIKRAYIQAWEEGCKGITIYRDGSKQMQVLETRKDARRKTQDIEKPKESVLPESRDLSQFHLTENALHVLERRALKKDEEGNVVETPEELWARIARYVAGAETKYDGRKARKFEKSFFEIMNSGEFFCGGTLIFAGLGSEAIMSKCLVMPIGDSIDAIFSALEKNIQVLRRGVGTGFNFSKIRSSYAKVATTGEFAAGPIEYLKMFNRAQDTIKGRGGRGLGSMAILSVSHPNIEEFIELKDDLEAASHYNISVGITDKFMKAVKDDSDWNLVDPHDHKTYKSIRARELFEKISKHAWVSGDPGMFFLDTAEKQNTTPALGKMEATNPCGEQPLLPFETCNLGNIDVSKFVKGFPFAESVDFKNLPLKQKLERIDWDHMKEVIQLGIRFLDNIIDVNNYPIPEIEEMTKKTRNIGLGLMGFADLLIKLGISYNSEKAEEVASKLMRFIQEKSHDASRKLGEEKGNFPAFKDSVWYQNKKQKFMRNTRTTTIAPTGSISIIANCNPGIEPIFALGYRRKNSMGGEDQEVIEHLFEYIAKERGFFSEDLMKAIADGKHLSDLKEEFEISNDVVDVFVTTHEIKPEQHVMIQAAFQKYIDSAVSKTINLPNKATWRDIAKVYELAYDLKCKGITVFRDGSKDPALQVGTKDKTKDESRKTIEKEVEISQRKSVEPENIGIEINPSRNALKPRKRPDVVKGFTYKITTGQGDLFITINEDDKGMFEVFLQGVGKSGSYTAGYIEAIGRLVSTSLRSGIEVEEIIKQLQGIRTAQPAMNKGGVIVYSVPDAVAKILKRHVEESKKQIGIFETKVRKTKDSKRQESGNKNQEEEKEVGLSPGESLKDHDVEANTKNEQGESVGNNENKPLPTREDEETRNLKSIDSSDELVAKMYHSEANVETFTEDTQSSTDKSLSSASIDDFDSKYTKENLSGDLMECPECDGDLEYAEGCVLCRGCGYSKCG